VKHILPARAAAARHWSTAALMLALAACGGPPPAYTDALARLSTFTASTAPLGAPVAVRPPVVITPSENVQAYLQYSKAAKEGLEAFGPLTNTGAVADGDPNYLITGAVSILRRRYPDLQFVESLAEAKGKGTQTTLYYRCAGGCLREPVWGDDKRRCVLHRPRFEL
jgi:hypothetical protein